MIKSLYVHVPFCSHICYYCDFAKQRYSEKIVEEYLERLEREITRIQQDSFETAYIGGGTPSSLSIAWNTATFENIRDSSGRLKNFAKRVTNL